MSEPDKLVDRHLRLGWWWLAVFVSMGVVLESLHGFKIGAYLDVSHQTRRQMWTLAHSHGTLLGLVHLGFAMTAGHRPEAIARVPSASPALVVAGCTLPVGFFLGGVWFHGGDPGLGVLLVPFGGLALVWTVTSVAWAVSRRPPKPPSDL